MDYYPIGGGGGINAPSRFILPVSGSPNFARADISLPSFKRSK